MGFIDSKINLFPPLLGERWGREQGPPGEPWFLPRAPSCLPASLLHPPSRAGRPSPLSPPCMLGAATLVPGLREPDIYIRAGRALGGQVDKCPHITAGEMEPREE